MFSRCLLIVILQKMRQELAFIFFDAICIWFVPFAWQYHSTLWRPTDKHAAFSLIPR